MCSTERRPPFCQSILSTPEGRTKCGLFHMLLCAGARIGKTMKHQCHAGASTLVSAINTEGEEPAAVLSTCFRNTNIAPETMVTVAQLAKELSLDADDLQSMFKKLPNLDSEKLSSARTILETASDTVGLIRLHCRAQKEIEKNLDQQSDPEAGGNVDSKTVLKNALSACSANIGAKQRRGKKETMNVAEVVAYVVANNPQKEFVVDQFAQVAGFTPNHFSTLFHKATGMTFVNFLTAKRMDLAKRLLGDTSLSIAEVACQSGYDDRSYFARRFKKHVGMTPREWRKTLVLAETA